MSPPVFQRIGKKYLELDSFVNELDFYQMSGILVQKPAVVPVVRQIFKSLILIRLPIGFFLCKLSQANGNFIFKILSKNRIRHF